MPSRSAPWAWENNVPIIITPGTLPHHGYLPSSDDRPTVPPTGTVQQPKDRREINISASGGLLPVLFGRNQTGGLIFRAKPTGDFGETFGIGFKLGHGEFDALEQTIIDPFATVTFYPGTDAQTANPSLGLTQRFPRVAYAVCEFDLGPTGGELTLPQFITRGKKIYDPRTTTTVYSANPALEALCLKTDAWFGQGLALSKFDLPAIEDIADYCDEVVSGTPRFECHIALREGHPFEDWENTILTHFAGHWTFRNGKYRLWSHRPTATVSLAITTDHIAANSTPTLRRGTSGGLLDEPNQITIEWVDPDTGFADKTLPIKSSSLEAGTESPRIGSNYQYSGCHIVQQAVRHGNYNLNSILHDLGLTIVGMPSLLGLNIGDRVTVTYAPLGLSARDFTVWDMKEDAGSDLVTVDLIEYAAAIWDTVADGGDGGGDGGGGQPGLGDPVPNVSMLFAGAGFSGVGKLHWLNPYVVTSTLWGAAAWSLSGFASMTASRVNDSNLSLVAFALSPATDGTARLDCGVAKDMRSLLVTADGTSTTWLVEYSDDDAAWTLAADGDGLNLRQEQGGEGGPNGVWIEWPSVGSHRYWRFRKGSALASALSVFELQFYEYSIAYMLATKLYVYNGRGTTGTLLTVLDYPNPVSTVASPLDLTAYTTDVTDVTGVLVRRLYVTIVAGNSAGRKSTGIYIDHSASPSGTVPNVENVTIDDNFVCCYDPPDPVVPYATPGVVQFVIDGNVVLVGQIGPGNVCVNLSRWKTRSADGLTYSIDVDLVTVSATNLYSSGVNATHSVTGGNTQEAAQPVAAPSISSTGVITFLPPRSYVNPPTLKTTGYWTDENLSSYDGTKVDDGTTTVAAFNINNSSGVHRLSLNLGSGAGKKFWACKITCPTGTDITLMDFWRAEYKLSGTWTAITQGVRRFTTAGHTYTGATDPGVWPTIHYDSYVVTCNGVYLEWDGDDITGTPEEWRIVTPDGSATNVSINEVQFLELDHLTRVAGFIVMAGDDATSPNGKQVVAIAAVEGQRGAYTTAALSTCVGTAVESTWTREGTGGGEWDPLYYTVTPGHICEAVIFTIARDAASPPAADQYASTAVYSYAVTALQTDPV